MRDTSPEAERVWLAAIRRLHPVERLREAFAFSEQARDIALENLAARHPDRTKLQLVELMTGERLPPAVHDRRPVGV